MRLKGEAGIPKPVYLESVEEVEIASRDAARKIPCRLVKPESGALSKGIFLYIHGGGWVTQSHQTQDPLLQMISNKTSLAIIAIGYRLAPEYPYPQGKEDCIDVAEYLIDNGKKAFGGSLMCMGGESAGGNLAAVTLFHLLESRPRFQFKAVVLSYGVHDLAGMLPAAHNFKVNDLILSKEVMDHYIEAYCPNTTETQRRDPKVSPLYADFLGSLRGRLPPALFNVGTLDCLLDDTVFMHAKWLMSGGKAILKVYPGAPHAFILFPPTSSSELVQQGIDDYCQFLREKC